MKLIIIDLDKSAPPIQHTENSRELIKLYEEFYKKIGFNPPWVGYYIIRNDEVVGSCGFTGQPENDEVEIAYWTFSEFENQGIASFACRELVRLTRMTNPFLTIIAKTVPEYNVSTHILQKNNFVKSGIVQDHEIGNAWLWKLNANTTI